MRKYAKLERVGFLFQPYPELEKVKFLLSSMRDLSQRKTRFEEHGMFRKTVLCSFNYSS